MLVMLGAAFVCLSVCLSDRRGLSTPFHPCRERLSYYFISCKADQEVIRLAGVVSSCDSCRLGCCGHVRRNGQLSLVRIWVGAQVIVSADVSADAEPEAEAEAEAEAGDPGGPHWSQSLSLSSPRRILVERMAGGGLAQGKGRERIKGLAHQSSIPLGWSLLGPFFLFLVLLSW